MAVSSPARRIRGWQTGRVEGRLVEGDNPGWIGDPLAFAEIAEKLLGDGDVPAILTPGGRPAAASGIAGFGIPRGIEVGELYGRAFCVGVHDERLAHESGEACLVGIATLA
jgi:hypothetical protein